MAIARRELCLKIITQSNGIFRFLIYQLFFQKEAFLVVGEKKGAKYLDSSTLEILMREKNPQFDSKTAEELKNTASQIPRNKGVAVFYCGMLGGKVYVISSKDWSELYTAIEEMPPPYNGFYCRECDQMWRANKEKAPTQR